MATPSWIPVGVKTPTCDKALALDIKLGLSRSWSHVVELWINCAIHHPNGRVEGPHAAAIVANRAGWPHDPEKFVRALVEARWLDETPEGYAIHGWKKPGHTGAHLETLEKAAEKQKKWRESHRETATQRKRNRNGDGNETVTYRPKRERKRERELETRSSIVPDHRGQSPEELFHSLFKQHPAWTAVRRCLTTEQAHALDAAALQFCGAVVRGEAKPDRDRVTAIIQAHAARKATA